MGLIKFAIENPVKIAVGAILVCLFGIVCILDIPRQLTPDVDQPIVTVETRWSGASPTEVASEIVDRQEERLKSVTGLRKMTSSSSEGSGKVTLEFDVGADKDRALRDVSEKLRQVSGYPEEVNEPTIRASDDDMSRTIAWLMLRGSGDIDVSLLKTFVEEKVKPILERADGIASVDVFGGRDREIQIRVDALKLAARGVTYRELEFAIRRQNDNISAGTIRQGKREYTYRTVGEYTSTEEIEDTVVKYVNGGPVHVRDVAVVIDGYKKQFAFVRSKGEYVIAIPARRETGANVIQAMASLKEQIAKVNNEVLPTLGADFKLDQVYDETVYITSAIDLVVNNIFFGGLLAVAVLIVFLRSASATGIVAVAIPLSVMGTFLVITMLGRTLNVVLLAGLAFAIGMVVDNAIVVLENIFRHRQMGKSRPQAAFDGAREVWGAVLASTLTTVAVFLPVIFIEEEAGQLFGDIAVAISAAVGFSLIVSILVIPPLAARFLGGKVQKDAPARKAWFVARAFAAAVSLINRSTIARVAVVAGFTGLSLYGSYRLTPDTDYLPTGNKNMVFGFLVTPPGYSIDEYKAMANIVEEGDLDDPTDGLRPAWEAELGSPEADALPEVKLSVGLDKEEKITVKPSPVDNFFFVSFGGGSFMGATSKSDANVSSLVPVMSKAGGRIPGAFAFFSQSSLFGRGMGGGASIDLEIRGNDLKKVVSAASAVRGSLMRSEFGRARATPSNFSLGKPEVRIIPDRAKAADLGLNVTDIGFIVEACVNGAFIGEFNDRGDRVDMALIVEGLQGATIQEVAQSPIYTPSGHIVPLSSAVRIESTTTPQQINHIEEMDSVTLHISTPQGTALQTAMRSVQEDFIQPMRDSGRIDSSVITTLAGNADKLTQTQRALIGDFTNTITGPSVFGLGVGTTVGLAVLSAMVLALMIRLIFGAAPATTAGVLMFATIAIGFCVINPEFAVEALKSRAMLAVMITYLLMAALFESFIYPFVIMFSVPLAAVGGFVALRAVHEMSILDPTQPIQQLDVLTMLGFVILLGVVVNNAILLVHQALTNIRELGMSPNDAITDSVRTRTRPIFMSALTSVFGMLPLVLMTGAGSELYRGLGSVVLGGLLFSTVFTLFVAPALFSLVLQWRTLWSGSSEASTARYRDGDSVPDAVITPAVQTIQSK